MKKTLFSFALLAAITAARAQTTTTGTPVRFYLQDFGQAGYYSHTNSDQLVTYFGTNSGSNSQYSYNAIFNGGAVDGVVAANLKQNPPAGFTNYTPLNPNSQPNDGYYSISQHEGSNSASSYNTTYNLSGYGTTCWDHTTGGATNVGAKASSASAAPQGLFMFVNANPANSGKIKGTYFELPLSILNIPGATYTASLWWRDMHGGGTTYTSSPVPAFVGIDVNTGTKGSGTSLANKQNPASSLATNATTAQKETAAPRNTNRNAASNVGDAWQQLTTTFTLTPDFKGSTLYFNVYNSDPGFNNTAGNDIGIDDIELDLLTTSALSGKVYGNDATGNGNTTTPYDGTSTSAPLYAVLVDNNGKVVQSVQVDQNGNYTFTTSKDDNRFIPYATGDIGLKVILSDSALAVGTAGYTTAVLPAGINSTGYQQNGGTFTADKTNSSMPVAKTDGSNVTVGSFYVENAPVVNDVTVSDTKISDFNMSGDDIGQSGYIGITTANNALSGSDAEDGAANSFTIGTIGESTLLYYDGKQLKEGDKISNYDPAKLAVYVSETSTKPASFTYTTTDHAGVVSEAATYTVALPEASKSISGTVYGSDGNGDGNGAPYDGTSETAPLYAVLTDAGGTVLQSVQVGADGTYTFTSDAPDGFSYASGNLNVVLSSTQPADGSTVTASTLPNGISNTGHQYTGADFTADQSGTMAVSGGDTKGINATLGNLYVENAPVVNNITAADITAADYDQQGSAVGLGEDYIGTTSEKNPLSGSDAEDGNITQFTIVSIGDNTVLYYQGTQLSAGSTISNYDPAGLVIYSSKNSSTDPSFTYTTTDAAGVKATPATYSLPSPKSLPVTILPGSFKAAQSGSNVALTWATATEISNAGFQLQHSADNKNWSNLSFVNSKAANGNSNQTLSYSYTDVTPDNGANYYRLIQTDLNGNTSNSGVVSINVSGIRATLAIYPNPVTRGTLVNISGLAAGANVAVYNVSGQLVQSFTATAASQQIVTGGLVSGTYFVKVVSGAGNSTATFIVK